MMSCQLMKRSPLHENVNSHAIKPIMLPYAKCAINQIQQKIEGPLDPLPPSVVRASDIQFSKQDFQYFIFEMTTNAEMQYLSV